MTNMKRHVIIFISFFLSLLLYNCNKTEDLTNDFFSAIVLQRGQDCGNTFLIDFKEDVFSVTGDSTTIYYANALPNEYKEEGMNVKIKFRLLSEQELFACFTSGIPFPHIVVTEVKE